MSKASHLPLRRRATQPSAIAFNLIFLLCCSIPILLVTAAVLKLTPVVLLIVGLLAGYETLHSAVFLYLSHQSIRLAQRQQPTRPSTAGNQEPLSVGNRETLESGNRETLGSGNGETSELPSFAVIVPAWNEAKALPRTLDSILTQSIQPDVIVVADDGSTDDTIATLTELYALEFRGNMGYSQRYPHLRVLQKAHTGKADSMNQALDCLSPANMIFAPVDVSSAPEHPPVDIVQFLDADTRLLPGSLASMLHAFRQNPQLTAVGGVLLPRCATRKIHGRLFEFMQRYEYVRTQLWRLIWSRFDSSLLVSGACSAFRRDALVAVGGFRTESWAEDYDIMFRLHQYWRSRDRPCHVRIEPDLQVYTDAPDNLLAFLKQRRRWYGGFLETMFQHRSMVGNARYGGLGLAYLVHNTLAMPMQPFFLVASLLTGLSLWGQQVTLPLFLSWIVLGKVLIDLALRLAGIRLYSQYFQPREVNVLGGSLETLVGAFPMMILSQISHTWGWVSCWHRQAKW